MTRYFIDADGRYLGGFDGADPPDGAIEVASAPADARQLWNGAAWAAVPVTVAETLAAKLAAGCTILSLGASPKVSGLWALDPETQRQIATVATSAAQFGLPRSRLTFAYPDAAGTPHDLTVADLGVLFVALRDYIDELYETAATLEAGGAADWPATPVTIA